MAALSTLLCFRSASKFFILRLHQINREIHIKNYKDFQKIVAYTQAMTEQIKFVYTVKKLIYTIVIIQKIICIIAVLQRQLFKHAQIQLMVQELLTHS